jgi:phage tail sheath protein FI
MDSSATRYAETVLNASVTPGHPSGLTFTDLAISGTAAERRPANGTFSGLSGGSDGLASLADLDFIGSAAGKTGMYALDLVDEIALLSLTGRATSAVHNAMISYCETWRGKAIFPVLDMPEGLTAQQAVDYVETTAAILNSSEFGAIYWPRPKVLNPDTAVFGSDTEIVVPSSGIICGVYSRTDSSQLGGVYQPPAGIERGIMRSVVGFETDECLDEKKRDIVFPKRINPITTSRGKPRYIDGARTLKGDGNFPSVPERRGVIFIEQSIKNALQFARHKNNNATLRAQVARTCENFLTIQMNQGAFRTKDPSTAFFVDFGVGLNPASVEFAGQLIGRIGLATNKPAEFIIVRFSQDTRAFDQAQA